VSTSAYNNSNDGNDVTTEIGIYTFCVRLYCCITLRFSNPSIRHIVNGQSFIIIIIIIYCRRRIVSLVYHPKSKQLRLCNLVQSTDGRNGRCYLPLYYQHRVTSIGLLFYVIKIKQILPWSSPLRFRGLYNRKRFVLHFGVLYSIFNYSSEMYWCIDRYFGLYFWLELELA